MYPDAPQVLTAMGKKSKHLLKKVKGKYKILLKKVKENPDLKNERGDWTVIEDEEYLSIRNNKTGKRYKFMLEEIED